ncbi:MAG TPA: hypothetical protein VJ731_01410 [Terriglobales bacterium]|nr:hypothetical protein [Terriglobales bacterium]
MSAIALRVRWLIGACIVAVLAAPSYSLRCAAQNNSSAPQSYSNSATQPKSGEIKPKLTPDQERGLRLLKAAEAEAAGLEPDMRAFVLWRASHAYAAIDPKKVDTLDEEAFVASQAIDDPREDDHCRYPGSAGDIKGWIQQQVLYEKLRQDKVSDIERLLPQATRRVRNEIAAELVRHYLAKKDTSRAETLLSQLSDSDEYPFGVAADLLLALGAGQTADRTAIFNEATTNFEQHASTGSFGSDDIGKFLERTWMSVPPPLALQATESILEKARSEETKSHYSMSTAKGSVVLNSPYELRLFELLPILKQLDKDEAESLLRDNTEVASQLQNYPKGLGSLSGTSYSMGYSDLPTTPAVAQQQLEAQLRGRVEEIVRLAASDPATALANALVLPLHNSSEFFSPRSQALVGIARAATKKNSSIAKSALDDLANVEDQLTPKEITEITELPEMYLALRDQDGAKKAIAAETKAAEKLYERDIDADDPNGAYKSTWPSTDLWRKCVQQAAKISPTLAEEIIAGIQDSDIATLEKVSYAAALLGSKGGTSLIAVADCGKNGASYNFSN